MADLNSPLSGNLKAARTAKGWSRRTLADRSGTSEATLARVELYGHTPNVSAIYAWATALDVPPSALLDPEPERAA